MHTPVFIGIARAPITVPSNTWKKPGILFRPLSLFRRRSFVDSELFPLATRGADPGGKRCTKCITLSLTSVSK